MIDLTLNQDDKEIALYSLRMFHQHLVKSPTAYYETVEIILKNNDNLITKLNLILRMFLLFSPNNESFDSLLNQNSYICYIIITLYYAISSSEFNFSKNNRKPYPYKRVYRFGTNDSDYFKTALISALQLLSDIEMQKFNSVILFSTYGYLQECKKSIQEYMDTANLLTLKLDKREKEYQLSKFSGTFQKIATEETIAKKSWLKFSLLFGILAVLFLAFNIWHLFTGTLNISLSETIIRISGTFLLFFISYWCGRFYSISRNQEITYRHIAAILNVYDMFKESSADGIEREIVITEMAHTIFSLPKLPNSKTAQNEDFSKMVELLKIFIDKKNSS